MAFEARTEAPTSRAQASTDWLQANPWAVTAARTVSAGTTASACSCNAMAIKRPVISASLVTPPLLSVGSTAKSSPSARLAEQSSVTTTVTTRWRMIFLPGDEPGLSAPPVAHAKFRSPKLQTSRAGAFLRVQTRTSTRRARPAARIPGPASDQILDTIKDRKVSSWSVKILASLSRLRKQHQRHRSRWQHRRASLEGCAQRAASSRWGIVMAAVELDDPPTADRSEVDDEARNHVWAAAMSTRTRMFSI